jgi:hypothetical protein
MQRRYFPNINDDKLIDRSSEPWARGEWTYRCTAEQ